MKKRNRYSCAVTGEGRATKGKTHWFLPLLLSISFVFSACGSANKTESAAMEAAPASVEDTYTDSDYDGRGELGTLPAEGEAEASAESSYAGGAGTGSENTGFESSSALDLTQHKIIRRAEMRIETEAYAESIDLIQRTVTGSGGYIEDMQMEGTPPVTAYDNGRFGRVVLRVPAAKFDDTLAALRKGGQVTYETIQSENVGAQYRDTEAHIKSIDTHLQSLDALMAKATKLEDMLRLEEEISRLRYEKEGLESNLRSWDDLVSFSTVTVELQELNSIAPVLETVEESREFTFGEEASYNFRSAWMGFVSALRAMVLWILSIWPTLLVLLIILFLVILVLRRSAKTKGLKIGKKERGEREAKKNARKDDVERREEDGKIDGQG